MRRVDPQTLRGWITDGAELAILDAREEAEFGAGHLFWAVHCPLSQREVRARALLPRLSARVVCVDDGSGLAETLAAYLAGIGCTDVAMLDGGTPNWARHKYELFSGINVPSKAFGEWVEHHYGTQSIDPKALRDLLQSGRKMTVLDSRPFDEFHRMSIPSAINVPGGELVYRIGDLVPDPETLVVVNCAGRTRSILGAESLRRAGVPNPVLALRNGTMGWELAGLKPETGSTVRFPAGTPTTAAVALERARAFAEASGVGVIGLTDLTRFTDDPSRTLYVLDVRDPDEFAAGHVPGTTNAPGGQLVQATDRWIAVRNARVALIDDDGVRARMTAAWLAQMGHRDVFVVEGALDAERTTAPTVVNVPELDAPVVTVPVDGIYGALVVDFARSLDFREGRIPGAVWAVRGRLDSLRARLQAAEAIVVSSPDGRLARLAAPEVERVAGKRVAVLDGGTAAYAAAGHTLERDRQTPPDEACVDVLLRPYDRNWGVEAAMEAYLAWETDLPRQIKRDGTVHFGLAASGLAAD